MDILHLKLGRFGIDVLWLKTPGTSALYLLPTIRYGNTYDIRYADVCFLYLLITFYFKHSKCQDFRDYNNL